MRKCNESHSKAGAVSLGFWNVNGPFELTDVDRAYGAEISQGLGEVSGSILIGVAPCGAANAGKYVKGAVKVYDAAGNAVDMARGAADMYKNGPSLSNVAQMAGGGAGFASGTIAKCFTEGTQIVVGAEYGENDVFVHYVTVNIEDIQVGDLVYSYDTVTGVVSQNEVTDVFVRESDHINYLTIADENGNIQVIETTDGHPFWVVTDEPDLSRAASEAVLENGTWIYHENVATGTNGYWVEAKGLRAGDVFLGANGELSTLVSAERVQFDETVKVYNFTVDGNHDYFVIAQVDEYGQTCILVHNASDWYIKSGVRRSVAARELKHDTIVADIFEGERLVGKKSLPLDQLHSPKEAIENNGRFKNIKNSMEELGGNHTPIEVEALGGSGQVSSVPLSVVILE